MRNQSEILKLPILSIQDGENFSKVSRIVINPVTRKADYLVLEGAQWYETPALLPFSKIKSIGRDLITIKGKKDLVAVTEELKKALAPLVEVTGIHVIDSSGEYISKVADFSIDPATGALDKLFLDDGSIVEASTIVTLSAAAAITDASGGGAAQEEVDPEVQFFIGKTVTEDIMDEQGNILIASGTVITHKEIDAARSRNALYELITAVK
jgi:uncharacterized protein YrrD